MSRAINDERDRLKDRSSHEWYMGQALMYARMAAQEDEVPIGAVVVDEKGRIIGVGYNQVEQKKTQIAHAEIQALQAATAYKGDWRLENCLLYVTLEPCSMCNGALRLSRLAGVVFGARSNLFGCHLDRDSFIPLYNNDASFFKEGVCEQECKEILKQFFQKKREQRELKRTKKRT